MSEGFNKVVLLGNLGADPELRMTNSGSAVLNMRVACSETYLDRNKTKQERTEWVNVVLWGKRAEALGRILSKGERILVEGGLRTSSYDDREGNKRYKTEVNATSVVLCGGSRGGGGRPPSDAKPTGGGGYSDADYGAGDDSDIQF